MVCCENAGATGSLTRAAARRAKIIAVARRLFAKNGFHATGIAQISEQSGIAVGQIYRDFECKERLVLNIIEIDCSNFKLSAYVGCSDGAALRRWIIQFINRYLDNGGHNQLFAEIVAESSRNDRIRAIFHRFQLDERTTLLNAICSFAPSPALLPQCEVFADTIINLSLGVMVQRLTRNNIDFNRLDEVCYKFVDQSLEDLQEKPSGSLSRS